MPALDPRLTAFLGRCDALGAGLGISRSTVSVKLFNDGKRLERISSAGSDIGLRRLAQAEADLATLEGSAGRPSARSAA